MNPDLMTKEELIDIIKEKVLKIDELNNTVKGMQKRIDELNTGGDTEAEMYAKEADRQRREMKEQLGKEKLALENKVKILEESNKALVKELRIAASAQSKNGTIAHIDIAPKKQAPPKKKAPPKKAVVKLKKTARKKK